jgi:hypothetical protein
VVAIKAIPKAKDIFSYTFGHNLDTIQAAKNEQKKIIPIKKSFYTSLNGDYFI